MGVVRPCSQLALHCLCSAVAAANREKKEAAAAAGGGGGGSCAEPTSSSLGSGASSQLDDACFTHQESVARSPTFQAWQLLDQVEEAGQLLLPFYITRKAAVTLELLEDLTRFVSRGSSFAGYAKQLTDARSDLWLRAEQLYYSHAALRAQLASKAAAQRSGAGTLQATWGLAKAPAPPPAPPLPFDSVKVRCTSFASSGRTLLWLCAFLQYVHVHMRPCALAGVSSPAEPLSGLPAQAAARVAWSPPAELQPSAC